MSDADALTGSHDGRGEPARLTLDGAMVWRRSHRADPAGVVIADRHYNRQHVGAPQFVLPGSCFVLIADAALWVTSRPIAKYVKHAWAGAWMNTMFRREDGPRASDMIRAAIAASRWYYGDPPPLGMVTFVDADKVRHKRDPGRCYIRAGFKHVGFTKAGLWAFQMEPGNMPAPAAPLGELFLDALPSKRRASESGRPRP